MTFPWVYRCLPGPPRGRRRTGSKSAVEQERRGHASPACSTAQLQVNLPPSSGRGAPSFPPTPRLPPPREAAITTKEAQGQLVRETRRARGARADRSLRSTAAAVLARQTAPAALEVPGDAPSGGSEGSSRLARGQGPDGREGAGS